MFILCKIKWNASWELKTGLDAAAEEEAAHPKD